MTTRCVALLSGGLDSMLSIRLMQAQGIEVEALNFKTIFTCCQDESARAAATLGVRLTIVAQEDDYLDLIRAPRYGYGKGANPCVDCRIYMFERARRFLGDVGAQFVVSGEVLGQRLMSQKRRDLERIAVESGLEDRLLRPLSAQRLPPTRPEQDGLVDRARLKSFVGTNRKGLIALAREFGFPYIPTPSNGCALTEQAFGRKVHDLIQLETPPTRWDYELLKVGRHYRLDAQTKVVVGRNNADNARLEQLAAQPDAPVHLLLQPDEFVGPTALLLGMATDTNRGLAASLVRRHSKCEYAAIPHVVLRGTTGRIERVPAVVSPLVQELLTIAEGGAALQSP